MFQRGVIQTDQQLQDLRGGLLVQPLDVAPHTGLTQSPSHILQQFQDQELAVLRVGLAQGLVFGVLVRQADGPDSVGDFPRDRAALYALLHGVRALQHQVLAGLHVLHLGVGLEGLQQQDARRPDAEEAAGRGQRVHRLAVRRERRLRLRRLLAGAEEGRHVAPVLLLPRLALLVVGELAHRLVGALARHDVPDLAPAVDRVLLDLGDGVGRVPHGLQLELQQAGDGPLHVVRPEGLGVGHLDGDDLAPRVGGLEGGQQGALLDGHGLAPGRQRAQLAVPQRGAQVGDLDEGPARHALDAQRGRQLPVAERVAGQPRARVDLGLPLERGLDAVLEQRLAGRRGQQQQQRRQRRRQQRPPSR